MYALMLKLQRIKNIIANIFSFFKERENKKCESPKIKINDGKYRYLSLARLYSGAKTCEKGITERKKRKKVVKKKGNLLFAEINEKKEKHNNEKIITMQSMA